MSSFATNLLSLINLRNNTQSTTTPNTDLNSSISTLNTSIKNLGNKLIENSFVALNTGNNSYSVNSAANTLIFAGVPVPPGYRCTLKDFNVNFTASGGSVSIVIMDYNAKNVLATITQNVSSSASGFGGTVLDPTTCVAIIINSQGAGTVQAYITGVLKPIVNYQ
ncbi:MAG: hypothetical protein KGI08_09875 [Thaumarchaeota archaeon]|nr:hypothetical protein [Nitrososphaerota archaeon]